MNRNGVLSMKDVMNFEYCPRIIYFEHVLREPQETTIKEFAGREKDKAYTPYSKRLKIIKREKPLKAEQKTELPALERKYKVWLYSREKNFQTVLDCLLFNNEEKKAFPLQFKNTFTPEIVFRTQKLQLYGEASLVKELLCFDVPAGFLKFLKSGDCIKIPICAYGLEWFEGVLSDVSNIIEEECLPEPTPHKKRCVDCCFKKQCLRT